MIHVSNIIRYPIKGFNGISLNETSLKAGQAIEFDRRFAFIKEKEKFQPEEPVYLPKNHFLMLLKNPKLVNLRLSMDTDDKITLYDPAQKKTISAVLNNLGDIEKLNDFMFSYLKDELDEKPQFVQASPTFQKKGHMFSDIPQQYVSIINSNSVRDFEEKTGLCIDVNRFRGNIILDGLDPWAEFDLLDKTFTLGDVKFKAMEKIGRCGATHVNTVSAERDLNILKLLQNTYSHTQMGIYAEVVGGGCLKINDQFSMKA
jgi:uncharacterized protein